MGGYRRLAGLYDGEYRHSAGDVELYLERLGRERARGPVLDLGCGTGRVAIPLAEAGFRVTGIDYDRAMLRRAWRRRAALPPEVAGRLRFSLQDMTRFALPGRCAAVVIAFSTFNLLTEAEARRACLGRIAGHLQPGGLLLLDLVAAEGPPPAARSFTSSFQLPPWGDLVHKLTEERFDRATGLDHVRYSYQVRRWADDRLRSHYELELTLARLGRAEVESLLYAAGFDVEEVVGDYRSNPLTARSPRMVVQARLL